MEKVFYIQNMVCDRCKSSIERILYTFQAQIIDLQLGRVRIEVLSNFDVEEFSNKLKANGFQLIKDPEKQLIESIKATLIQQIEEVNFKINLSEYLTERLHRDYSQLSKTFKKIEGVTLEKYQIHLKIEKAKEYIQMQNLSFSEIAYQLGYRSISHLSGQFKTITGMTMSEYQKSQDWNRKALDQIL